MSALKFGTAGGDLSLINCIKLPLKKLKFFYKMFLNTAIPFHVFTRIANVQRENCRKDIASKYS